MQSSLPSMQAAGVELADYWLEGEQSCIWGTSMNKLTGYIIVSIDPLEYLMHLGFCARVGNFQNITQKWSGVQLHSRVQ